MTISAVEGIITDVAAPAPPAELPARFSENGKLLAETYLVGPFKPQPYNVAETAGRFNVFLQSIEFDGKIYLVKKPPPESQLFNQWYDILVEGDALKALDIKAGDGVCQQYTEPENNVFYALVLVGILGPGGLRYRFSN